jgi:hypothetical protein
MFVFDVSELLLEPLRFIVSIDDLVVDVSVLMVPTESLDPVPVPVPVEVLVLSPEVELPSELLPPHDAILKAIAAIIIIRFIILFLFLRCVPNNLPLRATCE